MIAYNKKLSVNKLEEDSTTTDRNCILTTTTGHEPSQQSSFWAFFALFTFSFTLFVLKEI